MPANIMTNAVNIDEENKTNIPEKLSRPPLSPMNVLVCTHCDHPLCGPEDILPSKIDIHPLIGFSYEFEDLLNINTDECETPNCYRINVTSTTTLHTGENIDNGGRRTLGGPPSLVSDSASILDEAIRFVEEMNRQKEREAMENNNTHAVDDDVGGPISMQCDASAAEEEAIEGLIEGAGGEYVTENTNNYNNIITNTPNLDIPTQSQTSAVVRDLTIPETLTQEQSTKVDILCVKDSVCQFSVTPQIDKLDDNESNDENEVSDQNSEFSNERPIIIKTVTRDDTLSPEMEWFPKYRRGVKVVCAGCGMMMGWRFSLASTTKDDDDDDDAIEDGTPKETTVESTKNSEEEEEGISRKSRSPVQSCEENFVGLILREVKQREWLAKDISRQCMIARAIARREALVAMGGGHLEFLLPGIARNSPQVLEEDAKAKRQLEELTRSKLNQAVDDRVTQYRVQATLLTSLLEKHKEQTSVLMQLLKGQREKLATLDGKIRTYDEIFVAQRQQLETQQRHIMFQDELMKTLRGQTATSQGQIEEQHRILKEQNSTITKQNTHMKDLQAYVRSMVTTQIKIKSHLEAMARATNEEGELVVGVNYTNDGGGSSSSSIMSDRIISPRVRSREEIIAATAARMLAEMAEHENTFVVNYSLSDNSIIPTEGNSSSSSSEDHQSSQSRNTPIDSRSPT